MWTCPGPRRNPNCGKRSCASCTRAPCRRPTSAASAGRPPGDVDVAGTVARCGGSRASESRPHRNAAAPESNRVSERDQRSAGARHRRRRRCCPRTRAATASTTSMSATCRRRSWTATSRPPTRSAAWPSEGTQSSLQNDGVPAARRPDAGDQLPGLPIGTRGGMSRTHTFVQDGEYVVQVLLARDLAGTSAGCARTVRTSCWYWLTGSRSPPSRSRSRPTATTRCSTRTSRRASPCGRVRTSSVSPS
jgi:hypothetical protein